MQQVQQQQCQHAAPMTPILEGIPQRPRCTDCCRAHRQPRRGCRPPQPAAPPAAVLRPRLSPAPAAAHSAAAASRRESVSPAAAAAARQRRPAQCRRDSGRRSVGAAPRGADALHQQALLLNLLSESHQQQQLSSSSTSSSSRGAAAGLQPALLQTLQQLVGAEPRTYLSLAHATRTVLFSARAAFCTLNAIAESVGGSAGAADFRGVALPPSAGVVGPHAAAPSMAAALPAVIQSFSEAPQGCGELLRTGGWWHWGDGSCDASAAAESVLPAAAGRSGSAATRGIATQPAAGVATNQQAAGLLSGQISSGTVINQSALAGFTTNQGQAGIIPTNQGSGDCR